MAISGRSFGCLPLYICVAHAVIWRGSAAALQKINSIKFNNLIMIPDARAKNHIKCNVISLVGGQFYFLYAY
jgi:hypothetical protein